MGRAERRRSFGLGMVAALASTVMTLAVMEVGVRVAFPRSVWEFRDATDDWSLDQRLGWTQKSHLDVQRRDDMGRWIEFRTNADGVQPLESTPVKQDGTTRVLMLGDSTVVGRSVPHDARVHAQLERRLQAIGLPAEVLNAGVQGYSTDQELLRLEQLGPKYQPDIVILVVCANDFAPIAETRAVGVNKPRFRLAAGELHYEPPANQEAIQRFGGGVAGLIQYSALYRSLQPRLLQVRARLGNWHDRNLLGFVDDLYVSRTAMGAVDWQLFEALLARMDRSSQAVGARFYVYLHPALDEVWEPFIAESIRQSGIAAENYNRFALEDKVTEMASRLGVGFIPQISEFLARADEGPFHLLPRDPHCNEVCYEITSEIVARRIAMDYGIDGGGSTEGDWWTAGGSNP